jgi:hypothetical protein
MVTAVDTSGLLDVLLNDPQFARAYRAAPIKLACEVHHQSVGEPTDELPKETTEGERRPLFGLFCSFRQGRSVVNPGH